MADVNVVATDETEDGYRFDVAVEHAGRRTSHVVTLRGLSSRTSWLQILSPWGESYAREPFEGASFVAVRLLPARSEHPDEVAVANALFDYFIVFPADRAEQFCEDHPLKFLAYLDRRRKAAKDACHLCLQITLPS